MGSRIERSLPAMLKASHTLDAQEVKKSTELPSVSSQQEFTKGDEETSTKIWVQRKRGG